MNTNALIDFTQRLIRQPSLSCEEGLLTQIVMDEMRHLGFDRIWIDENGSAVGLIEGAHPGPTLLFDAHTDTVGIAPGSVWTHDPFGAEIRGSFLYGRGAADMKGALAAMVHAAASVDKSKLAGNIVVSASVMEEVYEGGALKTVMDEVKPDFVVIGEASELNLVRGGRGRAEIHLETIRRTITLVIAAFGRQRYPLDDESHSGGRQNRTGRTPPAWPGHPGVDGHYL